MCAMFLLFSTEKLDLWFSSCVFLQLIDKKNKSFVLDVKYWDVPPLCRAAVLERMPVIEKNSPGHTNGESTGEPVKDIQPAKVKQGGPLLPQQPANQVHYMDTDSCSMAATVKWTVTKLSCWNTMIKCRDKDSVVDFPHHGTEFYRQSLLCSHSDVVHSNNVKNVASPYCMVLWLCRAACSVQVKIKTGSFPVWPVFLCQVCDLLDLLGGSEEPLQPSPAVAGTAPGLPANTISQAGGDLLDLLGGLEPAPLAPGLTPKQTQTHIINYFRHETRECQMKGTETGSEH